MRSRAAIVFGIFLSGCATAPEMRERVENAEPIPAVAAADSAMVPGAGWFYVGANGGDDRDSWTGAALFGATIGGALVASNLFRYRSNSMNPYFGALIAGGVVALRFGDVHGVSRRAVELQLRRHGADGPKR
jgi:hypothetical protein